eukprot:750130-Hanusia_phi.AAC.5
MACNRKAHGVRMLTWVSSAFVLELVLCTALQQPCEFVTQVQMVIVTRLMRFTCRQLSPSLLTSLGSRN